MSERSWSTPLAALFVTLGLALTCLPAAADPLAPPSTSVTTPSPTLGSSAQQETAQPSIPAPSQSPTEPAPALQPVLGEPTARATLIAASWTPVADAVGYRVQLKTSAGGAATQELTTTRTAAAFGALKAHTDYWVQVYAVGADGLPLGTASAEVAVRTPYPFLAPVLQTTTPSSVRAELSWAKPAKGAHLQLEWTAPKRKPKRSQPSGTRLVARNLRPGTTYRVRARLVDSRTPLSDWSASQKVVMPDGDPLRVGSYNIQCANCRDWQPRRRQVAATIVDAKLDVIGIQEASHALVKGTKRTQFEDLARLLAPSGYRLTNLNRFNCRNADSQKKCRPVSRGASGAVRIAYNPATVRLISQGSQQLADLPGIGRDRYVAWAIFEHRINGKRFLFTSTHLEPRNDTPGSRTFYRIRKAQAQHVARTIAAHRGKLPAIAVGDYNSTKWDVPSNAPYDVMRAAGFVDPLGNSYQSINRTSGATVQKRINTEYSSYNNLQRDGRRTDGVNGSNPDYIFVTPMQVVDYETVVALNGNGTLRGTPPSDHNLIRATVLLP
ncbi:MAG: endonuclease/exonuclease/phosphatase family protein [Micropruina sp.]|uniref:endonuclease/exonuclease/phosphatase family protein n=1 Tax=Micropruina sp. TaxID=2737536 RepID=UPI0039E4852E